MEPLFTISVNGLTPAQVQKFLNTDFGISKSEPREVDLGSGPVKVYFSSLERNLARDGSWNVVLKGELAPEQ